MKFYLTILTFLVTIINLNAQTGSAEISSGGFSFIPAFTSKEPNLILNAETNSNYKLTGHLIYMVRLRSFTQNGVVLISRYKLIDLYPINHWSRGCSNNSDYYNRFNC